MTQLTKNWTELLQDFDASPYGLIRDRRIDGWKKVISSLPQLNSTNIELIKEVKVEGEWNEKERNKAQGLLFELIPWRKGPFTIQDILIDAEWQSHLKWERFLKLGIDLHTANILDVGSGNGYYGFRMLGKGAKRIVCLEPNLSHLTQFLAVNHFIQSKQIKMIPKRIEDLSFADKCFDLVFSMGVLYHQRDPENHLQLLSSHLKEKGSIILETLIAPDEYGDALIPKDSYANMSNVWFVHTKTGLENLANRTKLKISSISSSCKTTNEEQRTTKWMPFRSLSDALDESSDRSIEGLPRPERVILVLKNL